MLTWVWSVAGYILPFLFVLSLVVFFHEFGHFLIGRWRGVKKRSRLVLGLSSLDLMIATEPTGELRHCRLEALLSSAGFQPGDLIVSIDGAKIDSFEDMQWIVQGASDTRLLFVVATPRRRDVATPFGTARVGVLGVQSRPKPENWHVETYGSAKHAGSETWYVVARTGSYLKGLASGQESADQLSGPIRIAEVSGEMALALRHCSTWPRFCRFRLEC
jgi:membrane-associated protease RseP (regulator of RpoE activity)